MTPPDPEHLRPDTVAIRAGRRDNATALAPILWATSVFETPTLADARRMSTRPRQGHFYSRYANPTVSAFEEAVHSLTAAVHLLQARSGMKAALRTVGDEPRKSAA